MQVLQEPSKQETDKQKNMPINAPQICLQHSPIRRDMYDCRTRVCKCIDKGAQLLKRRQPHPSRLVHQQISKQLAENPVTGFQATSTRYGRKAFGAGLPHTPHSVHAQAVQFWQLLHKHTLTLQWTPNTKSKHHLVPTVKFN